MHRRTFDHPALYSFADTSQNNHQVGQTHWDNMQAARKLVADPPRPMNNVKIWTKAGGSSASTRTAMPSGWQEPGRIWVNRLSDGAEVGILEPPATVGGVESTGWIDLLTGITAFQRDNGEYLVIVEENYKAKCLIYRWRP